MTCWNKFKSRGGNCGLVHLLTCSIRHLRKPSNPHGAPKELRLVLRKNVLVTSLITITISRFYFFPLALLPSQRTLAEMHGTKFHTLLAT